LGFEFGIAGGVKCLKYSGLSPQKVKKIFLCFLRDLTATAAAKIVGVNPNTADKYYNALRERTARASQGETKKETGEFEKDESYFVAKRVLGAAGKTPVFGLLKRGGKIFVKIAANCSKEELMLVIQGKIPENAVIYTDGWKAYDGLVLNGCDHYRVYHSKNEFARGKNHINGIENFWSFAKRRLGACKKVCVNGRKPVRYRRERLWPNERRKRRISGIWR
jgi:transposase-like protein